MSVIERLTRTHADLEAELTQFARLLRDAEVAEKASDALAALRDELEAIQTRLNRHIASETTLAEQSDFVLGDGSMEEYGVPQHHERMRAAVAQLRESLADELEHGKLSAQFAAFLEHFDRYTDAELQFLRENASVLYPGGSIG